MAIKRNKQSREDETLLDLSQAKRQASNFFEDNQKIILGVLAGALLLVGGFYGYKHLIKKPNEEKAVNQMWKAQQLFEQDSFLVALENPGGGYLGFLDIINEYGGTDAGNLAKYYAGVSYLNLGSYDKALPYLQDYSPSGSIGPALKHGALGDVYSELNQMDKAKSEYEKAVSSCNNDFLAPYLMKKLAMLHESQGEADKALTLYKDIKSKYPTSTEALSIDKYIARAEGK